MSQLKTYTVAMIESEIWFTDVDAESEEEALAKAQAAYDANGHDDFCFKDSTIDGFEVVREQEADK